MMAVNMVLLVGGWTWTKLETPNFQNFLRNVWSPSKSIGFFFEIKQWSHLRSFLVKIKTGAGCWITCEETNRQFMACLSHVYFLFESQLKHLFLDLQGPWLIFGTVSHLLRKWRWLTQFVIILTSKHGKFPLCPTCRDGLLLILLYVFHVLSWTVWQHERLSSPHTVQTYVLMYGGCLQFFLAKKSKFATC